MDQTWINQARGTGLVEIGHFCDGLRRDEKAVNAAVILPWSNGQVEGQIHRLKLVKRQMYGRAKFNLLRRRVLPYVAAIVNAAPQGAPLICTEIAGKPFYVGCSDGIWQWSAVWFRELRPRDDCHSEFPVGVP